MDSLRLIAQQRLGEHFADKSPATIATRLNILYAFNRLLQSVLGEDEMSKFVSKNFETDLINNVKQSIYEDTDISAKNRHNMTALHIAAKRGHFQVLQGLIDLNADLCALNKNGQSPLDLANDEKCKEVLKNAGADGWTPLMVAVEKSQTAILREILTEKTSDIMAATRSGWTALHIAADTGSVETVRILVEAGADVNVTNMEGQTPLDLTREEECCEAFEVLGASRSPALLPGDSVKLSIAYLRYDDAAEGPLHPGDVGTVIKDDGSDKPYLVRSADGSEWYYCRPAVVPVICNSNSVNAS